MREPISSTGAGLDDVANLTGELSIADQPQVGDHTNLVQSTLRKAILCFNQTATTAFQQGQQVLASGSDAPIARSEAVAEISLLYKEVHQLANDAKILRHWMERSIVERVSLLGGQGGPYTKDLLKHFHKRIMENARNELNSSDDEASVLWQTAEECYKEAIRPSGRMGSDDYFYWIDRAAEESYEHENRLDVDEHHADLRSSNMEVHKARKMRERQETRQSWVEFWVRALRTCPGGPILFYPPAACSAARSIEGPPFEDVPRHLFRAFDSKGSGKTEDNFLASTMSMFGNPEGSKVDILSLETHSASEMLYTHLVKDRFGGSTSDNLMSWSSSLMSVIQFAIWRSHIGNLSPAEVRICVIDAPKFPPGQFVRDMILLKAFNNMELSEDQKHFFRFRLENPEYDNGEYLSQGVVNHRGRSCTFSLQDLIDGGLYELYPEFRDTGSGELWTNRVRELRLSWDTERETTRQEIYHAFSMARICSGSFLSELDIAVLLLTFKNRKLQVPAPARDREYFSQLETCGPLEVRRYTKARELQFSEGHPMPWDTERSNRSRSITEAHQTFGCIRVYNEWRGED